MKSGNIVIELQAGLYILFRQTVTHFYGKSSNTKVTVSEVRDISGNITETKIKVESSYVISLYHTKCKVLVNGRKCIPSFLQKDLRLIYEQMIVDFPNEDVSKLNEQILDCIVHTQNKSQVKSTPILLDKTTRTSITDSVDDDNWSSDDDDFLNRLNDLQTPSKTTSTPRLKGNKPNIRKKVIALEKTVANLENDLVITKSEKCKCETQLREINEKLSEEKTKRVQLEKKLEEMAKIKNEVKDISNLLHITLGALDTLSKTKDKTNNILNSLLTSETGKSELTYRPPIEVLTSDEASDSDSTVTTVHDNSTVINRETSNETVSSITEKTIQNDSVRNNSAPSKDEFTDFTELKSSQTNSSNDSTSVNNAKSVPNISTPSISKPVVIDDDKTHDIYDAFCHSDVMKENGSIYQGHVINVNSLEDVRFKQGLLYQSSQLSDITHFMVGYHIDNSYVDDGEDGGSKEIQKLLKELKITNVLVVVTRVFGGVHIGNKRWVLLRKCALQALQRAGYNANIQRKEHSPSPNSNDTITHKPLLLCDSIYRNVSTEFEVTKLNCGTLSKASDILNNSSTRQKKTTIIIGCGTNDLKSKTADQCVPFINKIVESVRKNHSGAKLVFCSVTPTKQYNEEITKLNKCLKALAIHNNDIAYIDTFYPLIKEKRINPINSDFIHLNSNGNKILSESFEENYTRFVVKERRTTPKTKQSYNIDPASNLEVNDDNFPPLLSSNITTLSRGLKPQNSQITPTISSNKLSASPPSSQIAPDLSASLPSTLISTNANTPTPIQSTSPMASDYFNTPRVPQFSLPNVPNQVQAGHHGTTHPTSFFQTAPYVFWNQHGLNPSQLNNFHHPYYLCNMPNFSMQHLPYPQLVQAP